MNKEIKLKCGVITKVDKNLIISSHYEDYEVKLEDVKEIDKAHMELAQGEKIYAILDSTNHHTVFTKEAQHFMANECEIRHLLIATLIILNRLPTRLLARFFISFHKPKYPVKIFKSIEEAKKWIAKQ